MMPQLSTDTPHPTTGLSTPFAATILAYVSLSFLGGFTYLGREVGEPATTVTDTHLLGVVAGWTRPWPLAIATSATFLGSAISIIAIMLVVMALLVRKRRWFDALYFVSAGIGAILFSTLAKYLVARMRPVAFFRVTEVGYSFPSGHALNSASLALALGFLLWRTQWRQGTKVVGTIALVLYVVCVGASRVVLGVHYPSDVLGGFLLGLGWGTLLMLLVLVYERRGVQGAGKKVRAVPVAMAPESDETFAPHRVP